MSKAAEVKDLVVLAADKSQQLAIQALLSRHAALGIRKIQPPVHAHPRRDPGCMRKAHEFLRPAAALYEHALVIFDHAGCGAEDKSAEEIEKEVLIRLMNTGWNEDRAAVVVIDPELESWVWSDSPRVAQCLKFDGTMADLRQWLSDRNLWSADDAKPSDPKAAVEAVLRHTGKGLSSAMYEELAHGVSFARCTDRAFLRLREILVNWFV